MQRAERLMKLLELLHAQPGLEAVALAKSCGVSGRTLQRDLEALGEAGFPVFFDRGYRLAAPALLPPITLTVNEALALRLAAESGAQASGAAARSLALAGEKLGQALAARPPEDAPSPQLALALPVKDVRMEGFFGTLSQAIAERRTVRITVLSRSGEEAAARRVDPYRLVPTASGWDLLGYHHERERVIRIALARLKAVSVLQRRFRPLPGRILERHLHGSLAAAPQVQWVRLRCRAPHLQTFKARPPVGMLNWEEFPDGTAVFTLAAFRAEDLLPWLLAWGDAIEVLEPSGLRQEILRVARALCERYGHHPAGRDAEAFLAASPPVSPS